MKTPGMICQEAYNSGPSNQGRWETAASAVLSSQWRPVSESPPLDVWLLYGGGGKGPGMFYRENPPPDRTHWMRPPPLPSQPEPTPQVRERAEFEAAARSSIYTDFERNSSGRGYHHPFLQCMWEGWLAARKTKENAK